MIPNDSKFIQNKSEPFGILILRRSPVLKQFRSFDRVLGVWTPIYGSEEKVRDMGRG